MPSHVRTRITAGASIALAFLAAPLSAKQVRPLTETTRLPAVAEPAFAGVGDVVCVNPARKLQMRSQMSVVGNRSTIVGSGHFLTWGFEASQCIFNLYLPSGVRFFSSRLTGARTALPPEAYRSNDLSLMDWSIARLATPVPGHVCPFLAYGAKPEYMVGTKNSFIITNAEVPSSTLIIKTITKKLKFHQVQWSEAHLAHDGNTISEDSGAPIFGLDKGRPILLGIHVGALDGANLNVVQLLPPEIEAIPRDKGEVPACRLPSAT